MKAILAIVLFAASLVVGATSYSSGAAAAPCESAPPNQKFKCCQNHPKSPACR